MVYMSEWETTGQNGREKYALEHFYTRSRENGGLHTSVKTNIPENLHGQIAAFVASGKIPDYRTMADVVRDSLVHRMKWVVEHYDVPGLEKAVTATVKLDRMMLLQREQLAEEELVEGWRKTLERTSRSQIAPLMALAREDAKTMTWDTPREELTKLLDRME
jgi:hypothetical protein